MDEGTLIEKEEGQQILRENMELLRKNLLYLLKKKRISISELSKRIDKDRFYIKYILHNPAPNPSLDGLGKIAYALDVPVFRLFKK